MYILDDFSDLDEASCWRRIIRRCGRRCEQGNDLSKPWISADFKCLDAIYMPMVSTIGMNTDRQILKIYGVENANVTFVMDRHSYIADPLAEVAEGSRRSWQGLIRFPSLSDRRPTLALRALRLLAARGNSGYPESSHTNALKGCALVAGRPPAAVHVHSPTPYGVIGDFSSLRSDRSCDARNRTLTSVYALLWGLQDTIGKPGIRKCAMASALQALRRVSSVISGGTPIRTGKPKVPKPRFT